MKIPDDVYKASVRERNCVAIVVLHRKRRFWLDSREEFSRHVFVSEANRVCNAINDWIRGRDLKKLLPRSERQPIPPKGWRDERPR